jgi:ankyrin repeat protein
VSIETATEKIENGAALEDAQPFHPNRRTVLHTAAENGSLEEVRRIVEAGIALDYGDTFGCTALWGAAKRGHKNIIRILLETGSSTNISDCEGVTPIAIAAKEGHWKAVDEILEHYQTIMHRNAECLNTQLHKSSESGDLYVLRIILKSCINVDTTKEVGSTPLHKASESGYKEACRILLKSGARVNAADKNGKTPLI